LKFKHGRAYYKTEDRDEKVWLIGDFTIGDRQYPLASITRIIEARLCEVFDIIREQLESSKVFDPSYIASGVVLTGGSANLLGIAEAAQRRFDLDARVADGPIDVSGELRLPEYSTTLGLLRYALTGQEERQEDAKPVSIIGKFSDWLNFN